jgi:predicted NUDIX family phosphoesterase
MEPAMSSLVHAERVLVVPTALFHRLDHFQGFSTDVDRYLGELLNPAHTSYRPRGEVEQDPSFKQLIPYVIFRYRQHDRTQVFQYTRGKGQGENRLHSKCSIGIGGHISAADETADGIPYQEGMRRELAEEVEIDTPYTQHCAGLINDDLTDVGKVHLGVVHVFDVERPAVRSRETDILEAGFRPIEAIRASRDRFETWSQICIDALFGE